MKGVVETLYGALGLELRVERGSHGFCIPGKAAVTEAGSLDELHPTLLEHLGRVRARPPDLFAAVPDCVVYEDIITTRDLQDIAVAVDEDFEVGALVDAICPGGRARAAEGRVFDVYRGDQVGAATSPMRSTSLPVLRSARLPRRTRLRPGSGLSPRS